MGNLSLDVICSHSIHSGIPLNQGAGKYEPRPLSPEVNFKDLTSEEIEYIREHTCARGETKIDAVLSKPAIEALSFFRKKGEEGNITTRELGQLTYLQMEQLFQILERDPEKAPITVEELRREIREKIPPELYA